ncbi:MAG: hypothetical protein LBC81_01105 [Tannerellaceae bacterium]|nr:hypothetical protein [Tannerellaceae bacterium]
MKKTILLLLLATVALLHSCINEPEAPVLIINGGTPGLESDSLGIVTAHSIEVFTVIAKQNGAKVEECGFLIVKEGATDTLAVPVSVEINTAPISINTTIKDLEPNTDYIIYPYARNKAGTGLGEALKVRTKNGMPEVRTVINTDSIKGQSAYVGLRMIDAGTTPVTGNGILLSLSNDMAAPDTIPLPLAGAQPNDSILVTISGLNISTTYYIQAFAVTANEIYKANILAFTTTGGTPVLGPLEIFNIQYIEASYAASIIFEGDAPILSKGVCWAAHPQIPTISDNFHENATSDFKGIMTNLMAGVRYNARAYAVNTYGTSYGEIAIFETEHDSSMITLTDIFSIADGSLMARAEIYHSGIGNIVSGGFCWATHDKPTFDDNYREMELSNVAPFSGAVTQLTGATTYYIRAFVRNSNGVTAYSKAKQVKTPDIFTPQTPFPGSSRLPNSISSFANGAGDIAYILGGDQGTDLTKELWSYNSNDSWHQMAAFPDIARKWQTSVTVNGIAYVYGGVDNTDTPTNKLYRYMPVYNQWENVSASGTWPEAAHSAAGTTFYYMAYFIGGNRSGVISNQVWSYNTLYTGWDRKGDFPVGLQKGIAVTIMNTIYAGLGHTDGSTYERRIWSLSYNNDTWTEETTLPETAGQIRTAVAFQRSIFMIDDAGRIWQYETESKEWTMKSLLPTSNRGDYQHCMFVLDNTIYIGLGVSYKSLLKYAPSWDN